MKIAVPTAGGRLCPHFGHCETFAVLEVDDSSKTIVSRDDIVPPPHEPGLLPRWLGEMKVNAIIAGGMGQRAQMLFSQQQIQVIAGAPVDTPEKIVGDYLNGKLQTGANTCDH